MDCNFIKNNLFAIAENRLPEGEMASVGEHIAVCNSCSARLSSFASFMEMIEKDRTTPISPFLTARILQKMEAYGHKEDVGIVFHLPSLLQPVLAAVLILLAVFTGYFAGKQGKYPTQGQQRNDLTIMKAELFASELNDEDKTLELYK